MLITSSGIHRPQRCSTESALCDVINIDLRLRLGTLKFLSIKLLGMRYCYVIILSFTCHNWVFSSKSTVYCYLEFKLCCLESLKLVSIRVNKLLIKGYCTPGLYFWRLGIFSKNGLEIIQETQKSQVHFSRNHDCEVSTVNNVWKSIFYMFWSINQPLVLVKFQCSS